MAAYMFVAGGGCGGFIWKEVAAHLKERGHDVFTPTLTGLGERIHLASPHIDLELHLQDIIGVFEYEDLHNIILVGHSYGGMVITGVGNEFLIAWLTWSIWMPWFLKTGNQLWISLDRHCEQGSKNASVLKVMDGSFLHLRDHLRR